MHACKIRNRNYECLYLAPELQSALEQFARPLFRRRAVHVFRDETNLSVTPHPWDTIIENLSASPMISTLVFVRGGTLEVATARHPVLGRPYPITKASCSCQVLLRRA